MDHEQKLKLASASYEAFNQRDLEALLKLYDSGCEWDMSNVAGWPEKRVYQGHEGLAAYFDAWLGPWEEFDNVITEAINLPGDRIFILGYVRGRGRLSGAPVESPPFAQIIDFRDGRFLRVDNYSDLEEGRSAAGLSE
jgi:ketosteroid isomerase-like protein